MAKPKMLPSRMVVSSQVLRRKAASSESGTAISTESAVLKSGPRFECISGEVLAVEFTTAANTFVGLYFPDGQEIGYGGQIVRRNNRFVLPIQARPRIDAKYRAAFDYHCRFSLPGDPIAEASRSDCLF